MQINECTMRSLKVIRPNYLRTIIAAHGCLYKAPIKLMFSSWERCQQTRLVHIGPHQTLRQTRRRLIMKTQYWPNPSEILVSANSF